MKDMRAELRAPKSILFPVDLSEHSASAAALIAALERRFQSRVVVLFALEPVDHPIELLGGNMFDTRSRPAVAKEHLAEFIARHHINFPHELRVEEGDSASVIVQVAEEINADLICMSTRGHGAFRSFLLGSTTAKVLNDAQVPVLTSTHVHGSSDQAVPELRSIVCAFAPDDRGRTALSAALLLAKDYDASLTVVHAQESGDKSVADEVERSVKTAGAQPSTAPQIVVSVGSVPQVVHSVAKDRRADLVVIGRSTPGPLGRLRSNSYAIVRSAPCPVLSV